MASLFCPFCGTENPSTRSFCRKCASDLHAPVREPNTPVAPEPAAVPIRPILIGGAIALAVGALVVGAIVILGGSPAAAPSPTPAPSSAPTAAPTSAPPATPTQAPIATPVATPEETPPGTLAPGESAKPVVDSLKGPRRASCTGDNGTGTAGYVHLTRVAFNTTGVRLSIDPPTPNTAYDYGYDDFPASGSADLPFTCDPPNTDAVGAYHQYVATTVHDGGRFAWRFIKVYVKP
jgi:hypothetical protein